MHVCVCIYIYIQLYTYLQPLRAHGIAVASSRIVANSSCGCGMVQKTVARPSVSEEFCGSPVERCGELRNSIPTRWGPLDS